MFDLSDRALVWIPVKWTVLRSDKPGKLATETEVSVELEVELLDRDELRDLFAEQFRTPEEIAELGLSVEIDGESYEGRDLEAVRFLRVVKGWRKVKDGKDDLELNDENVRKLMRVPNFSAAFLKAFLSACVGKAETRSGN